MLTLTMMNNNGDLMMNLPIKKRTYAIMTDEQDNNSQSDTVVVPPPPKKLRTEQKIKQLSSIVEKNGTDIIKTMIDHIKTIQGYADGVITDAQIIMERVLNKTDIAGSQGRLAIPKGEILTPFLTEEEADFLTRKVNAINMTTMDVKLIIRSDVYDMTLSRWNYKTEGGFKYVLKNKNSQWTKIKTDHNLNDTDKILVATFRYNNVLHFAILKHKSTTVFGKTLDEYRM